jgi:pimeloyl-ACP methyl ester carboxylesterase
MSDQPDRLSVDAHGPGALALLGGARPQAPGWFREALAAAPDRTRIDVEGAGIEVLTWGRPGGRGLLFLHGNGAHADWWSPLAPLFADDGWRAAALSWSGMGGSDWRASYHPSLFATEALAAAEHAGLFEGAAKPIVVAHSFGGFLGLHLAAMAGERFAAVVSVDSPILPPGRVFGGPPRRTGPNRVYATFDEALARFRLAPTQHCANLWYLDHVARGSIKRVAGSEGDGFTWKFDPFVFRDFSMEERGPLLASAQCPLALMWGSRSGLVPQDVADHMRASAPPQSPIVVIPDADHHVMLDQPLPFVAALRGLLAGWPQGAGVAQTGGAV